MDAPILFILYLRAIETLICRGEMSLIGSTSFGFAQNKIHDFQITVLNSVALSSANATQTLLHYPSIFGHGKGQCP